MKAVTANQALLIAHSTAAYSIWDTCNMCPQVVLLFLSTLGIGRLKKENEDTRQIAGIISE